jgi:hypothetical protein
MVVRRILCDEPHIGSCQQGDHFREFRIPMRVSAILQHPKPMINIGNKWLIYRQNAVNRDPDAVQV